MAEPDPEYLLKLAQKCRSLAASTLDKRTAATLSGMADEYEHKAQLLLAKRPQ